MSRESLYKRVAAETMRRLDVLGGMSDESGRLTRWFLSPAMQRVNATVTEWMRGAGMDVTEDAWGNLVGRRAGNGTRTLLLGSHLDTVRGAGKYDGPLGVMLGLGVVEVLNECGVVLPFHLDVVGFSDEEGLRFQATYLGSRALVGRISEADGDLCDADGVRLRDLIPQEFCMPRPRYSKGELVAFLEAHIEQGPVLESLDEPLGVVEAIAGQTRARLFFEGRADHAGTCPMNLRKDALAAASAFVLAVEAKGRETEGLVATVGQLRVEPGASNVVPAFVELTLDVRHARDAVRKEALGTLLNEAEEIATARGVSVRWEMVQENDATPCDAALVSLCTEVVRRRHPNAPLLTSGAGHDSVILACETPAAMLFVRCRGGISHHPEESVREDDVAEALQAMVEIVERIGGRDEGGR